MTFNLEHAEEAILYNHYSDKPNRHSIDCTMKACWQLRANSYSWPSRKISHRIREVSEPLGSRKR